MSEQDNQIYRRFKPEDNYDRLLFKADRVLQSAELNDWQDMHIARFRGVADVLFKEGDIINGCQCITNAQTGQTTVESGALYIAGAVRGIAPAALAVATVGTVYVGAFLQKTTVTELDEPTLYNPAVGTRGYGQAGAWREKVVITWGVQGQSNAGEFFPVWTIVDGTVMPKEPPPNIDAVTQALARYDRDSAGGTYIVQGMEVTAGTPVQTGASAGAQVFHVREGAARINGHALQLAASRRVVHQATPDLHFVDSEPHNSTGTAMQRVQFDRFPVIGTPQVRIQARKTVTIDHGGFSGAADPLPDNAVLIIDEVKQGEKVYAKDTDYVLTAGQVDWSPNGEEPNPGSSYQVTYQYMLNAIAHEPDAYGCSVEGALPGTLILVSYNQALRRYDRIIMDSNGTTHWLLGLSAQWVPKPPEVPAGNLLLATVYQEWIGTPAITQDSVRVVPMPTLNGYRDNFQKVFADLAELRLYVDAQRRDSGVKKGLFADPMLGNSLRDAGKDQTAYILGGWLQLPQTIAITQLGANITQPQTTPYSAVPVISQLARTGSMLVNPYMAFDPLPHSLTLQPAVDYWTEVDTQWGNPIVLRLTPSQTANTADRVVQEDRQTLEFLREIEVKFTAGFKSGDGLHSVLFDGLDVAVQPLEGGTLIAGQDGLKGRFMIPAGIPAGTKNVRVQATSGHFAEALFTGQGELLTQTLAKVTVQRYDPLAQTFTMAEMREICGADLWFTHAGDQSVHVQLRDVLAGVPGQAILAEAILEPAQIKTNGEATRANWAPILIPAGQECALVILTNAAETAVAIAELGAWDEHGEQWVASQPYQVGVLLSSSNASTWTAHQTRDLTFSLLATDHTANTHTIALGAAALQDATDLMVQAGTVLADANSNVIFEITLANGAVYRAEAGQGIQLDERYTGQAQVVAHIKGGKKLAGHLLPGIQLVAGSLQPNGDYVSPAINAVGGSNLNVVVEAFLPAGSTVSVQMQNAGSDVWHSVPFTKSSPQTAGVIELAYAKDAIAADAVRLRLQLAGSNRARPRIKNMRAWIV